MSQKTPTGLEPDPGVRPVPPGPPITKAPVRKSSHKGLIWFVILVGLAGAGYWYWRHNGSTSTDTASETGGKGGKKGGRGMGGPPPVVAVHARRGNIGVYVTGLGNVIPIYTVTVKSRVDGQLMDVRYKEGDVVQKGEPLLEIDPRPFQVTLEQAQGQLARDQALLSNAKVDMARYQTLLTQNAIPEQQVATQKSLVEQYEGTVKTDQANIHSAELNITYCHIAAPITGRIGLRLVDPGNIVHASDPNGLLVITQMEPISVIFPISERDLPAVRSRFHGGQRLPVEAWDADSRRRIATGALVTIDNLIDQTTGTVKLRADYDNKDNALFPNQMINARLLVQMKQGVVLLPTAAIQRTTESTYVWLLNPDDTVSVRNIQEGTSEGENSQIVSGLNAGDAVVMTGVDKLNEGSKVVPTFQEGGSGGGRGGIPESSQPGRGSASTSSGVPGGPGGITAPPTGAAGGPPRGTPGGPITGGSPAQPMGAGGTGHTGYKGGGRNKQ